MVSGCAEGRARARQFEQRAPLLAFHTTRTFPLCSPHLHHPNLHSLCGPGPGRSWSGRGGSRGGATCRRTLVRERDRREPLRAFGRRPAQKQTHACLIGWPITCAVGEAGQEACARLCAGQTCRPRTLDDALNHQPLSLLNSLHPPRLQGVGRHGDGQRSRPHPERWRRRERASCCGGPAAQGCPRPSCPQPLSPVRPVRPAPWCLGGRFRCCRRVCCRVCRR